MRILVTNDDGINSIGLHVLARALQPLGETIVAAPDKEYSGASASVGPIPLTTEKHSFDIEGIGEAWAVEGPPALIVFLAGLGAFGEPFDIVVSGINPGANVGNPVYLSGTIGAAVLARLNGATGIAISQDSVKGIVGKFSEHDENIQKWETAAEVVVSIVSSLKENPLSRPGVLNVNVPNKETSEIKGWIQTEIADSYSVHRYVNVSPVEGKEGSYKLEMINGDRVDQLPKEIDIGAVTSDYVSVTWLDKIRPEKNSFGGSVESSLDALFSDISGG
ncbi:MAG: 5'/3'-nucleotidase SurE [Acidimicrobiales bacterium]|nr:5'/3'-nucleotidase SurE [Acidimicrobiales bacterium]